MYSKNLNLFVNDFVKENFTAGIIVYGVGEIHPSEIYTIVSLSPLWKYNVCTVHTGHGMATFFNCFF